VECDPAHLDPEALLREASFVRVLAAHLLRFDDAHVDDVLQDTLVSALESPPRAGFQLRQWLRGVVRNLVAMDRRSRRRRRARELAATRAAPMRAAPIGDPAEIAMRYELVRLLVDAVHRLPEPSRNAILLRYFEGLEAAEIAAREQIAPATVRSRIQRGLDQLRERLDQKHGGDRSRWVLALAPIAALPPAAEGPAPAALAMAGWTKLVLGLVGAGVIVTFALAPRLGSRLAREDTARSTSLDGRELAPRPAATSSDAVRTEVVAPPAASAVAESADPVWSVRGRLVGLRPELPWRTPLVMTPSYDAARQERPQIDWKIEVAADGSFAGTVALTADERRQLIALVLDADDPAYLFARRLVLVANERGGVPVSQASFTTEIDVAPAARAAGRVLDTSGNPLAGVQVFAQPCDAQGRLRPISYTARTDASGRYRLRADDGGVFVLAATARTGDSSAVANVRPAALRATLASGVESTVPDLTLAPAARIAGHVLDRRGQGVANVVVCAEPASSDDPRASDAVDDALARVERWRVQATTADDGSFALAGLAPARYALSLVACQRSTCHVPAACADAARVVIGAPASDVVIPFGFTHLDIQVLGEADSLEGTALQIDGAPSRQYADARGRAAIELWPAHEYRITARQEGFAAATATVAIADDVATQHVELALGKRRDHARLRVTLVDESGRTVQRAWFQWRSLAPEATGEHGEYLEATDGVFPDLTLESGRGELRVRPGADRMGSVGYFREEVIALELAPGVLAEQRILIRPAARLEVRAVDADGLGLQPRCMLRDAVGWRVPVSWTRHLDGAWGAADDELWWMGFATADPPLAPGTYVLELSLAGYRTEVVPVEVVAARTTTLRVTMTRS
jgi:RNA polymerase sigma-70 factor (ECF subfamily)